MLGKPTYEELEYRVKVLEREAVWRQQAEEVLRKSEEKYRVVTENVTDVVFQLDLSGNFTFLSPSCEPLTGYSVKEGLSMNMRDIMADDADTLVTRLLEERLRADKDRVGQYYPPVVAELELLKKNGAMFWAEVTVKFLRDKDDNIFGIIGVLRDITGRKNAEKALQEAKDGLERRVEERTSELTEANKQLQKEIMDREQAEKALRESEKKYSTVVENSKDGIVMISDGLLKFVNKASVEIVGYTLDEMGDANFLNYVAPDFRDLVIQRYVDRLQGKDIPSIYEIELINKNGGRIPVELNAIRVDYKGKPADLVFIRDITGRKKTEGAHRESEARYKTLTNNLNVGVYRNTAGPKGKFIEANPAVVKLFGYGSREEFVKINVSDLYQDPNDRRKFNEKILRDGAVRNEEEHLRKKDGTPFIGSVSAVAVKDEKGDVKYYDGIVEDVTGRKRMEEALLESEEKYRTVLEASQDPVVVYDMEGKVAYFNPAFSRVFGWILEERLGKRMDVFVPEEAWPETKMMIQKVLDGENYSDFETRRYTKEGNIVHVNISAAIYKDRDGNPIGSVINLRDISEKKRLEGQLRQAQKMEAMGTLAGGVAHDFNNLLMGIQGRTSLMLLETDTSHPHFEHFKGIEDYVRSAADLTKQLLGFARVGKYEVKVTDLNELIKNQNRMFGRTKKEINVQGKYEKNLWTVEVDQGQIEQALLNIYVNAWQAMPGGGNLYTQTKNVIIDENYSKPFQVETGKYVKISITDTGVGMDEATRQRIFDPFFTTKEMGRGTGLGLASAYGVIKNHEGFINVYSEKGEGTTFNIYLPASEQEAVKEEKSPEEVIRGTETVLLVDDEKMILYVGRGILEKLGYEVLVAQSGKEAIEVYKNNPDKIDMVILDMIMPEMGGGETYDRLKEIDPDIKTLLSSGYSIAGQATEILNRGCNGFIQKPFNLGELSKKIREILDKK